MQPERTGTRRFAIVRHQGDARTADADDVCEELPVALVFNGISHAVMMVTPCDLEAFATGFALTEGLVSRVSDIYDVEVLLHADSAEVQLTVAQPAFLALKDRRRTLAGRTGCGLCGIESLQMLDLTPAPIARPLPQVPLGPALARACQELPVHQTLMAATGGAHAAAWCGLDGSILRTFEDVGRHNALDKLVGSLAQDGVDLSRGFVFLSSRASYELVRKAARMGIPMLATISAPTSLAIDIARQAGMRLVSFCRDGNFVEYADGSPPGAAS